MWFNFRFWTRPWWTWSRRTPTSRRGWRGTRPSDLAEEASGCDLVTSSYWSQMCLATGNPEEVAWQLATLKKSRNPPIHTCSSTFNAGCDGKAWWMGKKVSEWPPILLVTFCVGWLVTHTTSPANVNKHIHQNNNWVLPHEEEEDESAYNLLDEYDDNKIHMYTHTHTLIMLVTDVWPGHC